MGVVSKIGVWFDLDHMAHGLKTSPNGRMHARKHFCVSTIISCIREGILYFVKFIQKQSIRDYNYYTNLCYDSINSSLYNFLLINIMDFDHFYKHNTSIMRA